MTIERMHESLTRGQRQDLPILLSAAGSYCSSGVRKRGEPARGPDGFAPARVLRSRRPGPGAPAATIVDGERPAWHLLAGIAGCLFAMWGSESLARSCRLPPSDRAPLQVDLRVLGFCLLLSIVTGLILASPLGRLEAEPSWRGIEPGDARRRPIRGTASAVGPGRHPIGFVPGVAGGRHSHGAGVRTRHAVGFRDPAEGNPDVRDRSLTARGMPRPKPRDRCFAGCWMGSSNYPGSGQAALATGLPYRGAGTAPFEIVGRDPARPDERRQAQLVAVSPDFLNVIGLRLLKKPRAAGHRRFSDTSGGGRE